MGRCCSASDMPAWRASFWDSTCSDWPAPGASSARPFLGSSLGVAWGASSMCACGSAGAGALWVMGAGFSTGWLGDDRDPKPRFPNWRDSSWSSFNNPLGKTTGALENSFMCESSIWWDSKDTLLSASGDLPRGVATLAGEDAAKWFSAVSLDDGQACSMMKPLSWEEMFSVCCCCCCANSGSGAEDSGLGVDMYISAWC
mmetsp:Transcript_35363/g.88897  ORF Transcript_35363/g.88897 Transcript_35363/m.88897 type:complete len:200 (-) Transcript_35363:891-1490(-)